MNHGGRWLVDCRTSRSPLMAEVKTVPAGWDTIDHWLPLAGGRRSRPTRHSGAVRRSGDPEALVCRPVAPINVNGNDYCLQPWSQGPNHAITRVDCEAPNRSLRRKVATGIGSIHTGGCGRWFAGHGKRRAASAVQRPPCRRPRETRSRITASSPTVSNSSKGKGRPEIPATSTDGPVSTGC